ncbi:hypothetical protein SY83_01085 [Paenibacillus swuensis]|uniref:histidine kinase n=1 Tax=Paenibacillus swuensis TaxID=1178515 RepID=A0A172TDS6_9BACL|nr:sensor histidine kinase [Paenibacillus swuensis]ANE45161.1 hypothetical protein SY83_01085 [Paenibacillus swuensis]
MITKMRKMGSGPLFVPLKVKFIILFFMLITIPFIVSGTMIYDKYKQGLQDNTRAYAEDMVTQISMNLDTYMAEMERLTTSPLYDATVLQVLSNHSDLSRTDRYLNTSEDLKLNLFISSLSFQRSEMRSMMLFANDGMLFSNLDSTLRRIWDPKEDTWMSSVEQEQGSFVILPPHDVNYYMVGQQRVISLGRLIREPYSHQPIGIMKIDLTPKGFQPFVTTPQITENSNIYIYDKNGTLIYPDAEQEKVNGNQEWIQAEAYTRIAGLRVTAEIPESDLRQEAGELISFTLLISMASLIAAYLLAVLASNRLVTPIRRLHMKMKAVQRGSFHERAAIITHDEIGHLTEGFNTMVSEIERLVTEVYETKIRERDAELSALQSQIHPHFLYNTLESINMLAIREHRTEISDIVVSLGKLLRYTVNKQEHPVYMKDEIRFVESYLQIQSFRMGAQLNSEVYVDPSLMYALVPKLLIQPLVENAIEHGMGEEPLTIVIRTELMEEDLYIYVSDNGQGMTPENIQEIEERMYAKKRWTLEREGFDHRGKGYALRNIHQRLRLLYGEAYGLSIDSVDQKGSTFIIKLPFHWEE